MTTESIRAVFESLHSHRNLARPWGLYEDGEVDRLWFTFLGDWIRCETAGRVG
jgi:hypothetical protein